MKVYITCPVSFSQSRLSLLPIIKEISESNGLETFTFKTEGTAKEIFERDLGQLKSSNILIAEVSDASHGVGMEIGLSYLFRLKIILLIKEGCKLSKLIEGIPGVNIIKYNNINDLKGNLNKFLENLKMGL